MCYRGHVAVGAASPIPGAAALLAREEAKTFDIDKNPGKYPIFFFKTDTSGEKAYEEFYSDDDKYKLNIYNSLGFIEFLKVY